MKPRAFKYLAPETAAEALALLAAEDEDARVLAGGQSLVPLMNLRMAAPSALIDLNRCRDLAYVREEGDWIALGAMLRQADGAASDLVRRRCPLVARALELNGHPATRHRGTVGGTLAHADPVGELPGAAVALDAQLVIEGPQGRRSVPAATFFLGPLTTVLEPGEILVEARFPALPAGGVAAFVEMGVRQHDFAIAGVAAVLDLADGGIAGARLAAIGLAPAPLRLSTLEAALLAGPVSESRRAEAVAADLDGVELLENLHGSAGYRRRLAVALAGRALDEALAQRSGA